MLIIDQPKTNFQSLFLRYSQTPQGIYIMEGFSANVGVLPYIVEINDQPVATGILTSETELFNPKSLDSLNGAAVVKEHPKNFNAEITDMGGIVLSATPSYENESYDKPMSEMVLGLLIKVAIWGEELLDYISSGNTELSAGYLADIIESEGTYHGSPYSYLKTNIIYDHLAVVEKGSARNGNKSKLLSDGYESGFKILKDRTKKITDSVTVVIPNENKNDEKTDNNADINKPTDIIENNEQKITTETKETQTIMKNLVLPSGKIVSLADDVHQVISDDFDTLTTEKQTLEKTATQAKKEAETAQNQVQDSKTKTQELTQKIEESTKKFSKSVAIAAKAEKMNVTVDYENFDPTLTMRQALKDKYPDVDKVGEDTLYYLFNLADVPKAEEEVDDTENSKETPVKDSVSNQIKKHVKNEKQEKDVSPEDMSQAIADARKTKSKSK